VASSASSELTLPARRDWADFTARLATSWVGLFTAYVTALLLAFTKFKELKSGLHELGISPLVGIALVAVFPLAAFLCSTVPSVIEQRRIKRYAEITGALQTGYFTLRPRQTEDAFDRADNAHHEILRWLQNNREPVLYLTGASGTGKTSLLSACVLPKLEAANHVVIRVRGYEIVLLERIREGLSEIGLVREKEPSTPEGLRIRLERAARKLGERRVFVVIDQFEEFLILAEPAQQQEFQRFLATPIPGITFLLVYRPEYEGLLQEQPWPKLLLDTNRRVLSPFTENAAQEFMRKSGLTVTPELMRRALKEAAEIEQTRGLIRPVTLNLCGLVLGRFSNGLPRRFRGGLIRGFLRESLSLPEVRGVAGRLIPELITANVTKRPRRIQELAEATEIPVLVLRACLRRLGESDRAIVRPLDRDQDTWEISHDFLVPLLDSIVARRTVSLWRQIRPWLPWTATAALAVAIVAIHALTSSDPRATLHAQGWSIGERQGEMVVERRSPIPAESVPLLRGRSFSLVLSGVAEAPDASVLRELRKMTSLTLSLTTGGDISALSELKNLTYLDLSGPAVTDVSPLKDLTRLTFLDLSGTQVRDISALRDLTALTSLNLGFTRVDDISALKALESLTFLDLTAAEVADMSVLKNMKNLTSLELKRTQVSDLSALRELSSLAYLTLRTTPVSDLTPLRNLTLLTALDLSDTDVSDVSALHGLARLTSLDLSDTRVSDLAPLQDLQNLTSLEVKGTPVTDVSPLNKLKILTSLDIRRTHVQDVSALAGRKGLTLIR
jgi:Leucine-rich repeat (LRR) protein